MSKNNEIYYWFARKMEHYYNRSTDDTKLLPYFKLIAEYDIIQIAKEIESQIRKNVPNLASYAQMDLQCIHFMHGYYNQSLGLSEIWGVKSGVIFSEDLLSFDISEDIKSINLGNPGSFAFGFYYSKPVYDYYTNSFKSQDYLDLLDNEEFRTLCDFVIEKGRFALHLALKELIPPLNFPKDFPFIIGEYDGHETDVVYITE